MKTHRALLAEPSRVLRVLRLQTLALPADALPVPGADLADVLAVGRDAGVVSGPALAGGVPGHVPLGEALATAAHALAVVLASALEGRN